MAAGPAARLKSGVAFSSMTFMITVSAAVICGVTFKVSAASLNVTVTVLFAMVWSGIWTPCVTSASTLFNVVTRGVDRMRPFPVDSSAVRATSRLNAPLTEPSARPTALVAWPTPRFTAVGWLPGPCVGPTRPLRLPLLGNARFVVLPSDGLNGMPFARRINRLTASRPPSSSNETMLPKPPLSSRPANS